MAEEMKSPETKYDKVKAFAERPDDFVDIKTLVLAVRREEGGKHSTYIGPAPVAEMKLAIFDLSRVVNHVLDGIEIKAMQEAAGRIVPAKSGFANRVRGAFGKGG